MLQRCSVCRIKLQKKGKLVVIVHLAVQKQILFKLYLDIAVDKLDEHLERLAEHQVEQVLGILAF